MVASSPWRWRKTLDNLVLRVEDNGVGMSGEVQGGGRGMPILKGLAKSLQGKLEVDSGPAGTRAYLTFPAPDLRPRPAVGAHTHLH